VEAEGVMTWRKGMSIKERKREEMGSLQIPHWVYFMLRRITNVQVEELI